MQVYKAWSVAFSRVCQGDAPSLQPQAQVVVPPVTVVVRRRRPAKAKAPPAPCPLDAPRTEPFRPPARDVQYASPEATAAWLRRAVASALATREMGTEGLATVLAGRLDDGLAANLRLLRDSGQLPRALDTALREAGLERRPDVSLERIVSSALRRHALRPWLEALRSR